MDFERHPMTLNSLAIRLLDRFLKEEKIDDLNKAEALGREATSGIERSGDLVEVARLHTLMTILKVRFMHTRSLEVLDEAISVGAHAVALTSKPNPGAAELLLLQGNLLELKYEISGDAITVEQMRAYYLSALHDTTSPITERVAAGRRLLSSPNILEDPDLAMEHAETAIGLISYLTPSVLRTSDRQRLIQDSAGLASDAAAIALRAGKAPWIALQKLEIGRVVLEDSFQGSSPYFRRLSRLYPDLAARFADSCEKLHSIHGDSLHINASSYSVAPQRRALQRQVANGLMAQIMQTIRSEPSFEQFPTLVSEQEMKSAAGNGSLVAINVSVHGCDALIITEDKVTALNLAKLSHSELIDRSGKSVGSMSTLNWLWDAVVSPILGELGFVELPSSDDSWPEVWWIPTGLLVGFPLHAAGYHSNMPRESSLDRVISSYSSSVSTILYRNNTYITNEPLEALLVGVIEAPKYSALPYVDHEMRAVENAFGAAGVNCTRSVDLKEAVISELQRCDIFHFAGHGHIDTNNPLRSSLLLRDWEKDPLTLQSIQEAIGRNSSRLFAFLSTCGTGSLQDWVHTDEAIHMPRAFQLVGFAHVVGAIWHVHDQACVEVATMVYSRAFGDRLEDIDISSALHHAIRELRDKWLARDQSGGGSENLRRARLVHGERRDAEWPEWAPFVHFGG
ncbi:CHAT domain-containing protein [Mariannaea sp. PMI_226]|nr:CHAT domain-containing protein [Mariannaea sp. PMI_226]